MIYELTFYDRNELDDSGETVQSRGNNLSEAIESAKRFLNDRYPNEDHDWQML